MKKLIFVLATIFSFALLFSSCKKDQLDDAATTPLELTSDDFSNLQGITEDLDDEVEAYLDELGSNEISDRTTCPNVVFAQPRGTFPNTITLTYDAGCTTRNGRSVEGQIVIELSAKWDQPGATRTVSFVNFFVDGAQLEGGKILTNLGTDANGVLCFSRESSKTLTFPDGTSASWNASHELCRIEGGNTPIKWDDVHQVTGSATGVNRQGNAFQSEITEPLIKPVNCRFIVGGVSTLTVNGQTGSLDFGDGNCDRLAEITKPDGTIRAIILDPWWRR